MRKIFALAVALLGFCLAPAQAAGPRVQEVTSPKGLKLWLVEDRRLPLISLAFSFRGGVEQDPEGKQGLAVLTASLLTQGAGPYDAQAFQDKLSRHSISLSIDAGRDAIEGRLKTLVRTKEIAFDMASLALTRPHFAQEDFLRLRDQQETARRFQTASPDWQARYALYGHVFAGHPYGYRSLGSSASLARLTREDAAAFARTRLTRSDVRIVFVGALSAREAASAADRIFGSLPQGPAPDSVAKVEPVAPARTIFVPRAGTQTSLAFAAPMISREDPDWYAAEIANYILGGGGFESRLVKAVRAEKGLSYGIGTGLAPMDKASLVAGSFAVNNDKAAQALDLLKAEWTRLVREGASADEVEAAKAYLTGSWPLALTSLDAIAATLLDMREKGLPPDYLDRRNALIQTVDTKAVQAVLARAFDPDRLSFAIVGGAQGVQADEQAEEAKD